MCGGDLQLGGLGEIRMGLVYTHREVKRHAILAHRREDDVIVVIEVAGSKFQRRAVLTHRREDDDVVVIALRILFKRQAIDLRRPESFPRLGPDVTKQKHDCLQISVPRMRERILRARQAPRAKDRG